MPILLGNNKAYRRKTAMTSPLDVVEIYPKVFVYKNLYKDINFTYKLLEESDGQNGLFNPWSKWSDFGEYISPTFKGYDHILTIKDVESIEAITEKEKQHKDTLLEILNNFYIATKDYIAKNNVDFDDSRIVPNVKDKHGNSIKEWLFTGPSIARYRTDITDPVAMTYHTDYIREPIVSPGHKFAITALTYFNDDYEDGEIDFIVNGEAYMYKPEAGDIIVFPSGHPEFLMSEEHIYIHGVMPARKNSKYLSRMYWTKYSVGDPEWFENEEKFGKEKWSEMQEEIMQKFRSENPNKHSAEKERRIR
jgi:hypothetical protein